MAADTYNSILGLINQGTGNNNNNWGVIFETGFASPTERAIAGVNTITATSGTTDLSTTVPPAGLRLDVDDIQLCTGALVGDLTIQIPNVSKSWTFWNRTSNAFNLFVKVPSGVAPTTPTGLGGLVQIPQGCAVRVIGDGNGNLRRSDDDDIGAFRTSGKAAAGNGELACNGASLLRASFPNLFAKIGTTWGSADGTHFTLPNFTDTNRFLRAGGGSGPAVGTYQSNQNASHTHSLTGALTAGSLGTDSQGAHTHTITDPGHAHAINEGSVGTNVITATVLAATGGIGQTGGVIAAATTGISINSNGAHTHNITGVPGVGTLAVASQGGSEARPESAAVLICIRY